MFVQNGMLQPWLDERGLGGNTQALIFFAVAKMGEKPTDGITDVNPEGLGRPHLSRFGYRRIQGGHA